MKQITQKEIKEIQVNMLKYLDEICVKNNIEYFLMSGSLIGAIRHNGFIPWDDDIDVGLTRDNYQKLIEVLKKDNNNTYFLMDHSLQKDYYYPFAKLVDNRTILIDKRFRNIKNYGVYIDLLAMDGISENKTLLKKHYKKLKRCQKIIYMYAYDYHKEKRLVRKIIKLFGRCIVRFKKLDNIVSNYNKVAMEYNIKKSKYAISNWPLYKMEREIQITKNYKKTIYHNFENIKVKIPVKYDEILKIHFGDYMTLPPENERINHNNIAYWKDDE